MMRMALDQNFPELVFNSVKPWTPKHTIGSFT